MPPVVSTSTLSRDADRVAILVNPKAGPIAAQPGADRLADLLQKQGFKVEVFTDLAAATSQANRWHAEGCLRTLVGVGGDGTAAELVNRTDEGVPLTLFPAGNSNLLARYLGMSKDPEFLCRTIVEGVAARLDAGRANGRIFLLMIGCGFDAEVVNRVHGRRTGHISFKNYLQPVREVIRNYAYPEIQASWEDDERDCPDVASENGTSPSAAVALGTLAVRVQSALLRRRVSDRAALRRLRRAVGCVRLPQRRLLAAFGGHHAPPAPTHGRLDQPAAGGGCGSPPTPRCPIRSTAIPAAGSRWTLKCSQAG